MRVDKNGKHEHLVEAVSIAGISLFVLASILIKPLGLYVTQEFTQLSEIHTQTAEAQLAAMKQYVFPH
ncbi:hypothetical protein [Rhizobium laguerreae]|uniref:hypothetical protein n=1 Tax=Rhizobium laguerreae TaxID=1076926 RepID=UPI001C922FF5|nr:hypothetical protein [Rhizobium laguerreae]MBY3381820.1 hypothetical protein [Rhizobium laguerreae]